MAKTRCYHQGKEWISIIKSWRQERHPANVNKQNCHITCYHIDNNGNRPTLPQRGYEGLVLYELRSLDFKR